jgi:hypothetical protein
MAEGEESSEVSSAGNSNPVSLLERVSAIDDKARRVVYKDEGQDPHAVLRAQHRVARERRANLSKQLQNKGTK